MRRRTPELNVLVMTAFGSIDSAIELIKAGAFDYLTKPLSTDDLLLAVDRALAESRGGDTTPSVRGWPRWWYRRDSWGTVRRCGRSIS